MQSELSGDIVNRLYSYCKYLNLGRVGPNLVKEWGQITSEEEALSLSPVQDSLSHYSIYCLLV